MPKSVPAPVEEASTDLAPLSDQEAALLEAQSAEYDSSDLVVPILKVGQALTNEVTEGDAGAGEFINALTREGYGTAIGFIVSNYQKGRFAADQKTGRAFVAYGHTIPASWEDHPAVGKNLVGTLFSEHPDADETYRERVNANEIEWGSGPAISTTHNFTGYVVSEEEDRAIPVRLSLKRTDVKAAKKWRTILQAALRAPWDKVFDLTTEKQSGKGTYYTVNVKTGRNTTPEERASAVELASALQQQRVNIAGEDTLQESSSGATKGGPAPSDNGGLGV